MRLPFEGNYRVSQKWDDKCCRSNYARFGLLGHNGIDYACPAWTPILAPHARTIKEATFDPRYGIYIKVENKNEGSVLADLALAATIALFYPIEAINQKGGE